MKYFFTRNINVTSDAELNNYQHVNHNGDVVLVTTDYDRFLSDKLTHLGLDKKMSRNLFDEIQQVGQVEIQPVQFEDLKIKCDEVPVKITDQRYVYYHDGYTVCQVTLFPDSDLINQISYYDRFGNVVEVQSFDVRGFKSLVTTYGQHGGVAHDQMYSPNGALRYEEFYQHVTKDGDIKSTGSLVHENPTKIFSSRIELIGFQYRSLKKATDDEFYASQSFLNQYNFVNSPDVVFNKVG